MGFTYVTLQVANPATPQRAEEVELLADTGAMLSVIPRLVLERLDVRPVGKRRFRVFGGRVLEKEIGGAIFRYNTDVAWASVIFGEEGDQPVLGVTALEALGYQVDPISGELKPVELLLL